MTGRPHVTHDELRRRLRAGDPLAGETSSPEAVTEARRRTLEAATEAGHDRRLRGWETVPKRVWSGAAVAAVAVSVVVLAAIFSPWVSTPRDEGRVASSEEDGKPESALEPEPAPSAAANAAPAPAGASPAAPPTLQAPSGVGNTPAASESRPERRRPARTRRTSTSSPTIGVGAAAPTAGPVAAVAVPSPPMEGEYPVGMGQGGEVRQILYTTPGGTRIYWFLTTDASTTPRRHPEERTWSLN